ncbi:hypothetical protein [Alkalicoccobacillus porphyridii]|uniref:Uncharacterized protein n=1 Tax=Alkalicoccobacillus porphyridii TaxID=2597270 RepID=A0A554A160_9BACI|nr:hypothetical protein [Alkalicoccobacillus porphyridii]TSB47423.1 hypothetical protein FN960_06720 [Alkalicoccobacillus porphyridii]
MNQKKILMITPALIVTVSLLLISEISVPTIIGSTVTGLAFFALALALLTEEKTLPIEVKEEVEAEGEVKEL